MTSIVTHPAGASHPAWLHRAGHRDGDTRNNLYSHYINEKNERINGLIIRLFAYFITDQIRIIED